ncbi:hypothetical protein ACNOYE_31985 [Nannocystaceae bacterium ST9]
MKGPSLEQLRARPLDRELLLVHADWLQSCGDPRGELIAVQDAAECAGDLDEFERARVRASELIETHAELLPIAPAELASGARHAWGVWQRGYLRRLELLIDRPSPEHEGARSGLAGWVGALRSMLAHPSCALLEHLLLRFDLRGEPLDETEFALELARRVLNPSDSGPKPQLDLWSLRAPRSGARERLREQLGVHDPHWFSVDITRVPPPASAPVLGLQRALGLLAGDRSVDLIWLDDRGRHLALLGGVPSGGGELVALFETWCQVRRVAEAGIAFADEPVPMRTLARVLEWLAGRWHAELDGRPTLAPVRTWTRSPEPVSLAQGLARLDAAEPELARGLGLLVGMQWSIGRDLDRRPGSWATLIGRSAHELVLLAIGR